MQEALGRNKCLFSFDTKRAAWKTKKWGTLRQQGDLISLITKILGVGSQTDRKITLLLKNRGVGGLYR
jgi:hypothetical protein